MRVALCHAAQGLRLQRECGCVVDVSRRDYAGVHMRLVTPNQDCQRHRCLPSGSYLTVDSTMTDRYFSVCEVVP